MRIQRAGDRYRETSKLDKNMVMPDGKLSCVTCHQAYSNTHGSLAVTKSGSALCYQCHNI